MLNDQEFWKRKDRSRLSPWSMFLPKLVSRLAGGITSPIGGLLPGLKQGGTVKKTGLYQLHEGEKVIPAHRRKRSPRQRALAGR